MIPVVWLNVNKDAPPRGYWDQGLLEDLFAGDVWKAPGFPVFEHVESLGEYSGNAIFVIPGRQNAESIDAVNEKINQAESALVIITGDEEGDFPVEQLSHPNMRVWLMTPQPDREYPDFVVRFLGTGYPPGLRSQLPPVAPERTMDAFFSGQVTHARREDCVAALSGERNSECHSTEGFIQGMEQEYYWEHMMGANIAPAPAGPVSVDSFRMFEALETGCVPLADTVAGNGVEYANFWRTVFRDVDLPFPLIADWKGESHRQIKRIAGNPRPERNKVFAWWQGYKRRLGQALVNDLERLGASEKLRTPENSFTVLIPSSPIPAHPDTSIIEETIDSIRAQKDLGDCEIIVMIDGIRPEQFHYREAYDEYIERLLWLCNVRWNNVLPVIFDEHSHQGVMTRKTLDLVTTPYILFVEQDTPLTVDRIIQWDGLLDAMDDERVNVIRLHHEAGIHPEHESLMIDNEPQIIGGVELRATWQWSQRPHLADANFYRQIMNAYFGWESRTMIEDVIYGVLETHWREEKENGWWQFRLYIYTPYSLGPDIKRSWHLDGRADERKYDMKIRYDNSEKPKWGPMEGILKDEG